MPSLPQTTGGGVRFIGLSAACWLLACQHILAQDATSDAWTIAYLDRHVQALQHQLGTRMPILAWQLPGVPTTDAAVKMRKAGTLQKHVQVLWSKGIAPAINLSAVSQGTGTLHGAQALGATLEEFGIPVHIYANPPRWIANWNLMKNGKYRHYPWDYWPSSAAQWFEYEVSFPGELWPVFPLASPAASYVEFREMFKRLKAGDVTLDQPGVRSAAGLWMDYEDLPHSWNGARASQQHGVVDGRPVASFYDDRGVAFPGNGRSVRQRYGADVLNSAVKFQQYATDLRAWLLDESARKAFVEIYGVAALTGYYGDVFSTPARPFYDMNNSPHAIKVELAHGKASMPALYANNRHLRRYVGGDGQPIANQAHADDVYWHLMLKTFSSSATNAGDHARSVPWVAQYVREDRSGIFNYAMSVNLYKELLRHLWLRGAVGMYVFNPYNPGVDAANVYMTASHSIDELEYVRSVLDEMLCFRDFLERGVAMNFDYRPMFDRGPVWSGLARDGEAIVRVVSPNGVANEVIAQITVPEGTTFHDLPVPPGGATYILKKDGRKLRVDLRQAESPAHTTVCH